MARPKSFPRYPDCDRCHQSTQVIGYGTRYNHPGTKQLWYCNACQHKFCIGDDRCKMDDPTLESRLAAMALWLRFHALSARAIRAFLREFYGIFFSVRGLTKWLHRQMNALIRYLQRGVPRFKLGSIWHTDELFVRVRRKGYHNKWAYLWVVLDRQTRVVTIYLTRKREGGGFSYCVSTHWMKLGLQDWLRLWSGEYGLILVTDGARAYTKGLQKWKLPVRHVQAHISGPLTGDVEDGDCRLAEAFGERVTNNILEGLNSKLRPWVRSFRGLKGVYGGRTWAL